MTCGTFGLAQEYDETHHLRLGGTGAHLQAWLDGQLIFDGHDPDAPLLSGGVALVCEEGSLSAGDIVLHPVPARRTEDEG
jgi:hypothetical protein